MKKPTLSLFEDTSEHYAHSSLTNASTVGEIRRGLDEVETWTNGFKDSTVCFVQGNYSLTNEWIAYARHLIRKLSDEDTMDAVPRKMEKALHEVASWSFNLEVNQKDGQDRVPHIAKAVPLDY